LRILVVEDERTNRSVAQRLLSKLGHEVACVESGEEALKLLGEEAFDCVLMDIQMPGLDGLETTMVLRGRLGLKTPVIALTAHAMEGDRKRFIEAGMDGYVAKPFELGELQAELERVRAESGC
jgi:CheY-like chemotaxis protein